MLACHYYIFSKNLTCVGRITHVMNRNTPQLSGGYMEVARFSFLTPPAVVEMKKIITRRFISSMLAVLRGEREPSVHVSRPS